MPARPDSPRPGKGYVGFVRVSSREQEREGFSLDVQQEALERYAAREGGRIVKLFRVAETASKREMRGTFREMLDHVRRNAAALAGVLFYKVDRAARNILDFAELIRLEDETGVPMISVSQPTDGTPAGKMMRTVMAVMAQFYTDQQSKDVREGVRRRAEAGLFVGKAPYGYRNRRGPDGRSLVEVDPERAERVRLAFRLYASGSFTLKGLSHELAERGVPFTDAQPRFWPSKLDTMLRDRAYVGELRHRGQWLPGSHEPLVDRPTWEVVQARLGGGVYRAHDLVFACERIACGHCGRPVTGELKTKKTRDGERHYVYYRCSQYNAPEHPRDRVTGADLEGSVLSVFDSMRLDPETRDWFAEVLAAKGRVAAEESRREADGLRRQVTQVKNRRDALLDMRTDGEIDAETYRAKDAELRDREASLASRLAAASGPAPEDARLAAAAFELSQTLREKWLAGDTAAKRRLLETVFLNCRLEGATLVPTMRRPFDVLAEGPSLSLSRGDRRWTFPHEPSARGLLSAAVAQAIDFTADMFEAAGR